MYSAVLPVVTLLAPFVVALCARTIHSYTTDFQGVSVALFIALIVLALLLALAEVFLPGGILGVIALGCLLVAAGQGFVVFGSQGGWWALAGLLLMTLVATGIWFYWLPRSRLFQRTMGIEYQLPSAEYQSMPLPGSEGTAESDLRPSGIVRIEDRRYDAMADGLFIEAGSPIAVQKSQRQTLWVRAL